MDQPTCEYLFKEMKALCFCDFQRARNITSWVQYCMKEVPYWNRQGYDNIGYFRMLPTISPKTGELTRIRYVDEEPDDLIVQDDDDHRKLKGEDLENF